MGWTAAQKNRQADQDAAEIASVGIHTGDPGASGTDNEASGGSYARKASSFTAAGVEGELGASDQPATDGVAWDALMFDLPAGTFTHWSGWDSTDAFVGSWPIPASIVLASAASQQVSVYVSAEDAA